MDDRGHLATELRNEHSESLDRLSISDAFTLINNEDASIAAAIAGEKANICAAIELVVNAFRNGGRLIYVGAGTSGRLGVLDAAECPPTFLSDPRQVRGIIAGGHEALVRSVESAEDDPNAGGREMDSLEVGSSDVVFGIATGGTTPFVHGAIERGKARGASAVFFACVPRSQVADEADVSIRIPTGPEVLTGSTRMKAGTATKMVLNMVTTIAMVQTGKVYGNLMVDVNTRANTKLVDRGIRMVSMVTGRSREESRGLLERADGHVKTAIVMDRAGVSLDVARTMLSSADGSIAHVISDDASSRESSR